MCRSLPEIPHLRWSTNRTRCLTVVSATCDYYYQLIPTNFIMYCAKNEEWNVTDIISAVRCDCKNIYMIYLKLNSIRPLTGFCYKL